MTILNVRHVRTLIYKVLHQLVLQTLSQFDRWYLQKAQYYIITDVIATSIPLGRVGKYRNNEEHDKIALRSYSETVT